MNKQKDKLKKNGITVDGQTYTVTFKGRRLKLVKKCCCYFFLNCICMLMCLVIIYIGSRCGWILSWTAISNFISLSSSSGIGNFNLGKPCKGIAPHRGGGGIVAEYPFRFHGTEIQIILVFTISPLRLIDDFNFFTADYY